MNCPQCSEPIEPSAVFCGNCGAQLFAQAQSPVPSQQQPLPTSFNTANPTVTQPTVEPVQPTPTPTYQQTPPQAVVSQPVVSLPPPVQTNAPAVPSYAVAQPASHHGETKSILSVVFGALGIPGAFLIPIIGLVLGIAGAVLGTLSRSAVKQRLGTIGIVVSSLAIITSLGTWAYNISQYQKAQGGGSSSAPSVKQSPNANKSSELTSTPCYTAEFAAGMTVESTSNSCQLRAFNGQDFTSSTDVYKIYSNKTAATDEASFMGTAKKALEEDIAGNLPGFQVEDQGPATFAGSPAYIIKANDRTNGLAIVEAAVLHETAAGDNVFIMAHAVNGDSVNLKDLESGWEWK